MTTLRKTIIEAVPAIDPTPGSPPAPPYCIVREIQYTGWGSIFIPDAGNYDGVPGTSIGAPPGGGSIFYGQGKVKFVQECFTPTEGTPGSPGRPPTERSFQLGWNAGAVSIGVIAENEMLQFSVDVTAVGVVVGLNDYNEGAGYLEMEHALYFHNKTVQVMESGVVKSAPVAYVTADVFTFARVGTAVRYFKNTTKLYTSTVQAIGDRIVDASLFMGGDKVY